MIKESPRPKGPRYSSSAKSREFAVAARSQMLEAKSPHMVFDALSRIYGAQVQLHHLRHAAPQEIHQHMSSEANMALGAIERIGNWPEDGMTETISSYHYVIREYLEFCRIKEMRRHLVDVPLGDRVTVAMEIFQSPHIDPTSTRVDWVTYPLLATIGIISLHDYGLIDPYQASQIIHQHRHHFNEVRDKFPFEGESADTYEVFLNDLDREYLARARTELQSKV